jgi:hypothetical protein
MICRADAVELARDLVEAGWCGEAVDAVRGLVHGARICLHSLAVVLDEVEAGSLGVSVEVD